MLRGLCVCVCAWVTPAPLRLRLMDSQPSQSVSRFQRAVSATASSPPRQQVNKYCTWSERVGGNGKRNLVNLTGGFPQTQRDYARERR